MKKKLNRYLVTVSVLAIALTLLFTSLIFWKEMQTEAMDQVKSTVSLIASYDNGESPDAVANLESYIAAWVQPENPTRITRIAADGTVLFDNEAEAGSMVNHLNRPEVQEALQNGTGEDTRASETMAGSVTCYYAKRL